MKIGIVGLPNVGKSTLFKALTHKEIDIANYPFCTIDPNVGVVKVPDERLEVLAKLSSSKKIINTVIEFVDIAGLVKGASQGEGLGNEFLSHIQMTDAILHLVRFFENENIKHVSSKPDPVQDIEVIESELILKDLGALESAKERAEKEAKAGEEEKFLKSKFIVELYDFLVKGKPAREFVKGKSLVESEEKLIRELNLLTSKPVLHLFNVSEDEEISKAEARLKKLKLDKLPHVVLSAKTELDLMELTDEEKAEIEAPPSRLSDLIKESYRLLGLITFLTTGPDETRAWTVKKGSLAPEAGAAIHTDFREKFIRAKVVSYDDLVKTGSMHVAQTKGKLRTEGKDYIVKEGDVVEFVV